MSPEADAIFEAQRPRLLRLAYRMLGSHAEAEDMVQDAWLRWREIDPATVRAPPAFLARTVTRLCLDAMKSARAKREIYVGSWLPEPLIEPEDATGPDDLTLTLMLALERLSPLERAAFLLHDVFEVPLDEVAATIGRAPPAVRQLAVRARQHVKEARPRFPVEREEGDRIALAFHQAASKGDVDALRGMLAETVVLQSDGGGKVIAFLNPIAGIDRVLRLFAGLQRKPATGPSAIVRLAWIDGLPGFISRDYAGVLQTTALAIEDGRIEAIYITRNPDKLVRVARSLCDA